jgi:DNA-binding NarL/FixJ family response regulator
MSDQPVSTKKRIVIIEDNADIREGFAVVINHTDQFEVISQYSNCETALKQLQLDKPDAVLMDIELPGMNGIEGTAIVKKHMPECMVIIITVYEDTEKVFRSLCAGAGGYIIKNSDPEMILRSIQEAFAGGAPMSLSIAKMVVQSFQQQKESPLSVREAEVLQAVAQGKSATKIASELFISRETVRSHVKNIYQKLAVNNKAEALKIASNNKWISGTW